MIIGMFEQDFVAYVIFINKRRKINKVLFQHMLLPQVLMTIPPMPCDNNL